MSIEQMRKVVEAGAVNRASVTTSKAKSERMTQPATSKAVVYETAVVRKGESS